MPLRLSDGQRRSDLPGLKRLGSKRSGRGEARKSADFPRGSRITSSTCGWRQALAVSFPSKRYADDIICHCRSAEEARALWSALDARFTACKLVLRPQKTKLVYCKDTSRRGDFPIQSFDFLGYTFRPRLAVWHGSQYRVSFLPAASPKALKAIRQTIRRWAFHHRSDKSLDDLARMFNPYI